VLVAEREMLRPHDGFAGVDVSVERRRGDRPKDHPQHDESREHRDDDRALGGFGNKMFRPPVKPLGEAAEARAGLIGGIVPGDGHSFSQDLVAQCAVTGIAGAFSEA